MAHRFHIILMTLCRYQPLAFRMNSNFDELLCGSRYSGTTSSGRVVGTTARVEGGWSLVLAINQSVLIKFAFPWHSLQSLGTFGLGT